MPGEVSRRRCLEGEGSGESGGLESLGMWATEASRLDIVFVSWQLQPKRRRLDHTVCKASLTEIGAARSLNKIQEVDPADRGAIQADYFVRPAL